MALKDKADALLRGAVGRGDVPGVIAAVTDRDRTVYEAGFGRRVQGEAGEMTPDTVVYIASMTKAITSVAAMQLVERGVLALDYPAKDYVPQIGDAKVLTGFDAAGKPQYREPARPVTLRHLLTHTSGFGYEFWQQPVLDWMVATGAPSMTTCENRAMTAPLLFDPGTRWEYGIGIDWAGRMVEIASGRSLGDYLAEHVFAPLGMDSTGFRITEAMRRRLAKIHARGDDGSLAPQLDLEIPQAPEFQMGGGGLYGTVGDYAKFIRMVLNGGRAPDGRPVLRPATLASLTTNQAGANRVGLLRTVMPPFSNDAEFFPGLAKTWSFAFMINLEQAPTGRSAGALGWAGLANTYYWIDPAKGFGGVYATQIIPFADAKAFPLYLDFETAVYDSMH
ncbi:MAG: serine hydrolase domain-containing protein [Alphaproteobacteria bacterium]